MSTRTASWRRRVAFCAMALLGSGPLLAVPAAGAAGTSTATAAPIGAYTTKDAWTFMSAPTLHPPKVTTDTKTTTKKLAKGDFLLANFPNVDKAGTLDGQGGPMILNSKLQPVWFKPVPSTVVAMDLEQQTFEGKPALSWWQGVVTNTGAAVSGKVIVVNDHYKKVASLVGTTTWVISPHDVQITGQDAWVTAYKDMKDVNLSAYGGASDGTLYDFGVQEYDLETGKLLYTWDANQHVSLSQSYQSAPATATTAWDAYHGNSLELVGKNELLVSLRNTWAAYLVTLKSGTIIWTLGGKTSTFTIPKKAQFEWQHDVMLNTTTDVLTVFDDNCCEITPTGTFGTPGGPSHGLVMKLDTTTHTAKFVGKYTHGTLEVGFTGSTQVLTNGNVLVGFGSQPYFSEYTKGGKMILDGVLPGKDLSYRALFTNTWVGTPSSPPSGAARKTKGKVTVYASWNGSTQVTKWKVLAGSSSTKLTAVATKAKSGFETSIPVSKSYKAFKVEALNSKGRVLGTSEAFMVPTPGFY